MSLKYKYFNTCSLLVSYFANALNFYVIGPTLINLSTVMQTNIETISNVYSIRSAAYTFGALSGFAFNYINRQLCIIIFTALMGVSLGLMPALPLIGFFIISGVNGFMAGGSDTGINAWMMEMWSEKSGPYMQALHFAFGAGSILAPLISQPFLSDEETNTEINKWSLITPYLICAAVCVVGAIFVLFLFFNKRYKPEEQTEPIQETRNQRISDEIIQNINNKSKIHQLKPSFGMMIAILGCLLLATYVAMEMTHLSFQPTFVVFSKSNFSESEAASLSSATAAAFTVMRGVGIFIALKVPSHIILFCHFLFIIGANILIIFTYDLSSIWMWVGNILVGIGCSSVYPTIYSFLQQNFNIDNKKASIFLFVGGATSSLYPLIVGRFIENYPLILIYLNLISIGLCIIILSVIRFVVFMHRTQSYSLGN